MRGGSVRWRLILWAVLCSSWVADPATAIGDVRYRSPRERVLGMGPAAAAFVYGGAGAAPDEPAWTAEAGERYLFGIAGLKTAFLRWGLDRGAAGLTLSAAFLSSPVGGEKSLAVEPFYRRGDRFVLSGGATMSMTAFDGFRTAYLLTVGVRLVAALSRSVAVGYRIEEFRAAGEQRPGVETELYAVAWRDSPLSAIVRIHLDRSGEPGLVLSSRIGMWRSVEIAIGYDERTASLLSAVDVGRRPLGLRLGAVHHPVLGVSKAIFVRWGRGW
ncbi:MAG: hypothetical protein ACE5EO_04180 [Candidatus Krumholzibacteriia bacterium]